MKSREFVLYLWLALVGCTNSVNTIEKPISNTRNDSIEQKENNIKAMLILLKRDYPDGKNRIMDSTKNAFEKRIKELDSLKELK